jgi:two-component system, chemotaxis family, protein-glutamate methylesterase/glutaminase
MGQSEKIRVLIADDSALMRQKLRQIIEAGTEFEVAGVARDGEDAIAKARELRPDVLSLDINMPRLDGVGVLQLTMSERICPVVMVSSLTQKGAVTTFECLELGAFDFVGKPDGTVSSNLILMSDEIRSKLKMAAVSGTLKRLVSGRERRAFPAARMPKAKVRSVANGYKAVAIGISTGGPVTLMEVLPLIPAGVHAALFLVQHMPGSFIHIFVNRLNDNCQIEVVEAEAGMQVRSGVCYVAPGEHQLTLYRKTNGEVVIRTPTQPQTLFVPSVDVMMKSVLQVYGPDTVGVLMTGIGTDGAEQMVAITKSGGHTIAESEESSVVYGMPRQAIENGGARVVAPSWQIASEILRAL